MLKANTAIILIALIFGMCQSQITLPSLFTMQTSLFTYQKTPSNLKSTKLSLGLTVDSPNNLLKITVTASIITAAQVIIDTSSGKFLIWFPPVQTCLNNLTLPSTFVLGDFLTALSQATNNYLGKPVLATEPWMPKRGAIKYTRYPINILQNAGYVYIDRSNQGVNAVQLTLSSALPSYIESTIGIVLPNNIVAKISGTTQAGSFPASTWYYGSCTL